MLGDLGLEVAGCHGPLPTPENINQVIEEQQALGSTRRGSGVGGDQFESVDSIKRVAEKFSQAADTLAAHGIQLQYHNHWWEMALVEGRRGHSILMENAPNLLAQVDTYWVEFGKASAIEVVLWVSLVMSAPELCGAQSTRAWHH